MFCFCFGGDFKRYVDFEWEFNESYTITDESATQIRSYTTHCVSCMNADGGVPSWTQTIGSILGVPFDNQVYNFAFPFEYEIQTTDTCLFKPPTVFLQVNSLDYWDRHRCEGYAMLTLPTKSGSYNIQLQTFRAVGNIADEMKRFFIGGGSCFVDKKCIGIGSNKSKYSNVS